MTEASAPRRTQSDQLVALQRVQGLLDVARLVGSDRSLDSVLSEIARTISEALGFQGVAFNLYRPAWDDFIVSTVHGSEAMCETLLGEAYDWSVWELPLQDRFERRGAYFIPHGMVDWSDPELGARYVPERTTAAGDDAWIPGDELFVSCRHSDGHLLGIVSVGEPISGRRPSDDQLDLLVAMVSLTARALQGAQEAVEAARHRIALEQLLQVSSRLSERRSIDQVLQEVCDGVSGALDFQKVMIELVDPETGLLTPRAVVGWDGVAAAPEWRVSVARSVRSWTPSRGRGLLPGPAGDRDRAHAAAQPLHLDHERARAACLGPPLARGAAARRGGRDRRAHLGRRPGRPAAALAVAPAGPARVRQPGDDGGDRRRARRAAARAGRSRLAHRAAQPARLHARAGHRDRALPALRPALRPGALRPRRLQEHQRHRRPPRGRPRAGGGRRAAGEHHPRQRLRLPHRRRRVRVAAARDRRRRGAGCRQADRHRAGGRQCARRRAGHQLRARAVPDPRQDPRRAQPPRRPGPIRGQALGRRRQLCRSRWPWVPSRSWPEAWRLPDCRSRWPQSSGCPPGWCSGRSTQSCGLPRPCRSHRSRSNRPPTPDGAAVVAGITIIVALEPGTHVDARPGLRRPAQPPSQFNPPAAMAPRLRHGHPAATRTVALRIRLDRRTRLLAMALAGCVVGLVLIAAHRADGVVHVEVLDVGQGDAILVEGDHGGRMLVDGGPDPGRLLVALEPVCRPGSGASTCSS